jgi:hypothetical protein
MQVLFGQILTDQNDKEIQADGKPFTLKEACYQALFAVFQDEQNLAGEEKFKRYGLYQKIKASTDPADLSAEEIALLKKLIGKAYGALIVGQCWNWLEGK